jgi:hypothetical protein
LNVSNTAFTLDATSSASRSGGTSRMAAGPSEIPFELGQRRRRLQGRRAVEQQRLARGLLLIRSCDRHFGSRRAQRLQDTRYGAARAHGPDDNRFIEHPCRISGLCAKPQLVATRHSQRRTTIIRRYAAYEPCIRGSPERGIDPQLECDFRCGGGCERLRDENSRGFCA